MMNVQNKIKYIDAFAGIGGMSLGIDKVFSPEETECVGFIENSKHPMAIYNKHFPNRTNFGDIETLNPRDLPDFDLLVGGSPCQDLSVARSNRKNLDGSKSKLFFNFLEILLVKKPKYFLLENVNSMTPKSRDRISNFLGVEPVMIDSALVSAQNRKRLYWANWPISQPKDLEVFAPSVVAWSRSTRYKDKTTGRVYSSPGPNRKKYAEERERTNGKAHTLTTGRGCGSLSSKNYIDGEILTPASCEHFQTLPVCWTLGIPLTARYKAVGNAVTVMVIKHIMSELKKHITNQ